MTALLLSEPLHFGDYGGMPLKILWAVLDVLTIIVLGSGLYLWFARGRKAPVPPNRRAARNEVVRSQRGAKPITLRQMWQAPSIIAAATLVGLIAALVGDGWHDALSWAALSIPV